MTNAELAVWILGGVAAVIFWALVRLRDEIHKVDNRVAKIETKLGMNGKD